MVSGDQQLLQNFTKGANVPRNGAQTQMAKHPYQHQQRKLNYSPQMKQGQNFAKFQQKKVGQMAPLMPGKRAHSKNEKYDLALDNSPMNLFNGASGSTGQQQFKVNSQVLQQQAQRYSPMSDYVKNQQRLVQNSSGSKRKNNLFRPSSAQ